MLLQNIQIGLNMSEKKDDLISLNALRVDVLYSNTLIPIAVTLIGCISLLFLLWSEKTIIAAITWLSILTIILAIRSFIVLRYHDSKKTPEDYAFWLNMFFIGVICSGSVLGSTAYVFIINNDIINISLLMMFILVLISGSIGIYSVFQRIYYGFTIPTVVPLVIYLLSQQDQLLNKLCIILIAFVFFIFIIQFHSHKMVNQLVTLKLDNNTLLENYDLDHERINILERMFNRCEMQLKNTREELRLCQEKLGKTNNN